MGAQAILSIKTVATSIAQERVRNGAGAMSSTGSWSRDGYKDRKGRLQQKIDDGDFVGPYAMQYNARTLANARVLSGVVAGCVAGLLNYGGLSGVGIFLLVTVLHSAMMCANMASDAKRHFLKARDLFISQISGGLLSFILFWTIAYDVVHIF